MIAPLRDAGIAVDVSMAHIRQFEQKPWLADQLRRMEARAALKKTTFLVMVTMTRSLWPVGWHSSSAHVAP